MSAADPAPAGDRETLAAIVGRVTPADLAELMVARFQRSIPGYRRLPQPVVLGQILDISRRNVELFFRYLAVGEPPSPEDLAAFRHSAKDRAAEGMPLEDLLHAYRLGSRIGWNALHEAALPAERPSLLHGAELLLDYIDQVSAAVSQAYLEERQHLVSEEERQLRNLLDALVKDGVVATELRALAEQLGLPLTDRYRPFAAAVREAPARRHSELAARLRGQGILALTEGVRVAGLAAEGGVSQVRTLGADVVVALAAPTPRGALSTALDDMRLLADLGQRLGRGGAVTVDELLPELLLASAPRVADALSRRVLGRLESGRPQRAAELLDTLAAYLDSKLDRRLTARRLHVHPNTLDYRLRQVQELSGLDVHRPDDLVLVVLALRQRELTGAPRQR
jgi:hypothetical protein